MSDVQLDGPVDPERARELLAKREAAAIDLRGDEIADTGRLPGAVAVLGDELTEAADRARHGNEDLPILVLCEDGDRSAEAAEKLKSEGYEAAPIEGGWENWTSSGQPTQPKTEVEFEGPDLSTAPGT